MRERNPFKNQAFVLATMSRSTTTVLVVALVGWYAFSVLNNVETKKLLNSTPAQDTESERFDFPFTLCLLSIFVQGIPTPLASAAASNVKQAARTRAPLLREMLPYSAFIAGTYIFHRLSLQHGDISVVLPTKTMASILLTTVVSHVLAIELVSSLSMLSVGLVLAGTAIANSAAIVAAVEGTPNETAHSERTWMGSDLVLCTFYSVLAGFCGSIKAIFGSTLLKSRDIDKQSLYAYSRFAAAAVLALPAAYFEGFDIWNTFISHDGVTEAPPFPIRGVGLAIVALYGMDVAGEAFLVRTSPVVYSLFNTLRAGFVSIMAMVLVEKQPSEQQLGGVMLVFAAAMLPVYFKRAERDGEPQKPAAKPVALHKTPASHSHPSPAEKAIELIHAVVTNPTGTQQPTTVTPPSEKEAETVRTELEATTQHQIHPPRSASSRPRSKASPAKMIRARDDAARAQSAPTSPMSSSARKRRRAKKVASASKSTSGKEDILLRRRVSKHFPGFGDFEGTVVRRHFLLSVSFLQCVLRAIGHVCRLSRLLPFEGHGVASWSE